MFETFVGPWGYGLVICDPLIRNKQRKVHVNNIKPYFIRREDLEVQVEMQGRMDTCQPILEWEKMDIDPCKRDENGGI